MIFAKLKLNAECLYNAQTVNKNMDVIKTIAALLIDLSSFNNNMGAVTNASRYHDFARKYFMEIRMSVEKITVIRTHINWMIRIQTRKWIRFGTSSFLLYTSKAIEANASNNIKGSSGRSVPSDGVKLYSIDQGMEARSM